MKRYSTLFIFTLFFSTFILGQSKQANIKQLMFNGTWYVEHIISRGPELSGKEETDLTPLQQDNNWFIFNYDGTLEAFFNGDMISGTWYLESTHHSVAGNPFELVKLYIKEDTKPERGFTISEDIHGVFYLTAGSYSSGQTNYYLTLNGGTGKFDKTNEKLNIEYSHLYSYYYIWDMILNNKLADSVKILDAVIINNHCREYYDVVNNEFEFDDFWSSKKKYEYQKKERITKKYGNTFFPGYVEIGKYDLNEDYYPIIGFPYETKLRKGRVISESISIARKCPEYNADLPDIILSLKKPDNNIKIQLSKEKAKKLQDFFIVDSDKRFLKAHYYFTFDNYNGIYNTYGLSSFDVIGTLKKVALFDLNENWIMDVKLP